LSKLFLEISIPNELIKENSLFYKNNSDKNKLNFVTKDLQTNQNIESSNFKKVRKINKNDGNIIQETNKNLINNSFNPISSSNTLNKNYINNNFTKYKIENFQKIGNTQYILQFYDKKIYTSIKDNSQINAIINNQQTNFFNVYNKNKNFHQNLPAFAYCNSLTYYPPNQNIFSKIAINNSMPKSINHINMFQVNNFQSKPNILTPINNCISNKYIFDNQKSTILKNEYLEKQINNYNFQRNENGKIKTQPSNNLNMNKNKYSNNYFYDNISTDYNTLKSSCLNSENMSIQVNNHYNNSNYIFNNNYNYKNKKNSLENSKNFCESIYIINSGSLNSSKVHNNDKDNSKIDYLINQGKF